MPCEPLAACAHMAAFVRKASRTQVQELWHETGRAMLETLSDQNLWLSTSGVGVAWLHIRLDSYPSIISTVRMPRSPESDRLLR